MSLELVIILYIFITSVFLITLFCLLFSKFNREVLSRFSLDAKMLFYIISITLIMVFLLVWYCFTVKEFIITTYLIICSIFLAYTAIILLVIYLILSPLRKLQDITADLALGKRDTDIDVFGSKEFENIEANLQEVQNNYKNDDKRLNAKDNEYQKYLPKSYFKFLYKTTIEQRQVGDSAKVDISIMFCDVRNSFFSSGTMNLEENFKVINNFLGIVSKEVRKNHGFVDKFMGDGVLAVFEKEADALKSASSICEKLEYENLVKVGVNNIDFGIAVHTGSVIVGIVGEDKQKSTTIISDAVNLVSRVEHLNKMLKTKILFTKNTLNGLDEQEKLHYRYIGTMKFDDLTEPIPLFEGLDGFKGIRRNALIKTAKIFESAVRSFEKEDYKNAKELFIQVLKDTNDDYLSKFYLTKCNIKLIKRKN